MPKYVNVSGKESNLEYVKLTEQEEDAFLMFLCKGEYKTCLEIIVNAKNLNNEIPKGYIYDVHDGDQKTLVYKMPEEYTFLTVKSSG